MGFTPFGSTGVAHAVASTGIAGYTLINGTGTVLSWTAPTDGQLHYVTLYADKNVTSGETGGAVTITVAFPTGGGTFGEFPGGQGAGVHGIIDGYCVAPGSTVTVQQSSALTAGASVMYAVLVGA